MIIEAAVDTVAKPLETTARTPQDPPSGIRRLLAFFGL